MEQYQKSTPNGNPQFQPRAPFVRVSRKHPCPACGKYDNCNLSADGRIAYCRRVRGDKQGRDGGWLHYLTHDSPPPKVTPPKPKPLPIERADADHLDAVMTTLIRKYLVLSEPHKESLRARGLSESEIERNGYRSTPVAGEGDRIASQLSVYGLEGTPGFYRQGSVWHMKDISVGILIPVRDERSRIVGLQIRRDVGEPRYIWFSSNGFPCGTSSGSPVHFAKPHLLHNASEALITEGGLKADICAHFLNQPVIAAAGVSNFGQDFAGNLKAKFPNLKIIFIAFDSDWRIKPSVKTALERLMYQLSGVGFRVKVRTWPPQYKGIDDYLLALDSSRTKGVAA
jgi:hypothetical protein